MSALPALPRRERLFILASVSGLASLAWAYTIHEAHSTTGTAVCDAMRMNMSGPDFSSWPAAAMLPLFLMWAVMMIAMMLPGALPMILTFAAVSHNRRQRPGHRYVPAGIFVAGYVAVWCGFSVLAAFAQWWLHRHALLSAAMMTTSRWLGGTLIIAAGVFQFTPLKQSCLTRCRGPLEFIMTHWREGRGGAFRMGVEHGAFCAGCCWALMALLFVAGVMNVLWIVTLTVIVCLEKMLRRHAYVSLASGVLLFGWGCFVLLAS